MRALSRQPDPTLVPDLAVAPLRRFPRQEGVTVHVELASLFLTGSATEGVHRRTYLHLFEARLLEHRDPTCARQATGNSTRPQVDLAHCLLGDGPPVGNVGELKNAAWT